MDLIKGQSCWHNRPTDHRADTGPLSGTYRPTMMPAQFRQIDIESVSTELRNSAWVPKLVWGFVILGAAIRLLRYALRFPLGIDESMLAEN
jgi:hypothetical protein